MLARGLTVLKPLEGLRSAEVRGSFGAFYGDGGRAFVYEVIPTTTFGFGKSTSFSQTRWRFKR
jgi:hypothetical protein